MAINPKSAKPQYVRALPEKTLISTLQMQSILIIALSLIGLYVCFLIVLPFLSILIWSLVLAVLFQPFHAWINGRLHHKSLSALLTVLAASIMVVIPIMFVLQQIVMQAIQGARLLETQMSDHTLSQNLALQPQILGILSKAEQYFDITKAINRLSEWMLNSAGLLLGGSAFQVISFILVFYMLFFFLRDKQMILNALIRMMPLSDIEMTAMFEKVNDTIHGVVYGGLVVACIQGALGGLMFWWLGLPAPFVWGLIMSLLSVIPMFGAFIIWIPAAIYLFLFGHWIQALVLMMWGILVVGTIDNFLRPILLGNRLQLHTMLVFLSILGGALLFGSVGLILGPITVVLTMTFLRACVNRNAE